MNPDLTLIFDVLILMFCVWVTPYQFDVGKSSTKKRVVYGTDLTDKNSYAVMKFFVFITHGHQCGDIDPVMEQAYKKAWNIERNNAKLLLFYIFKQINLNYLCEPLRPEFLHCGGVLLTEYVVQTACHCVANLVFRNSSVGLPVKNSLWEYPFGLYANEPEVDLMRHGVRAKFITYHSKCGRYFGESTHDYGLLFTTDSLLVKEWKNVQPAPVYTISELSRIWNEVMRQQRVCLFVGFGPYRYYKTAIYGPPAPMLQHAWRYHQSYYTCYRHTFLDWQLYALEHQYNLRYIDIATWSCSYAFGKNVAFGSPGDSGSPVTCGDQYYGMHTGGIPLYHFANTSRINTTQQVGVTQAIVFTIWENSAEFRNQLNFLASHFTFAKQYSFPTFRPFEKSSSPILSPLDVYLIFILLNCLNISTY